MNQTDLKKVGLKATLPRIKILQILESSKDRHLSAEDVYRILIESGEEVGLATVYRVLTQFEEAELVRRHHFSEGHSIFELEDGIHHDHLVCVKCGHVEEFIDSIIEDRQKSVAENARFQITDHHLTIYGICHHCQ